MTDAEYFKSFADGIWNPTRIPMTWSVNDDQVEMMTLRVRLSPKFRRVEMPTLPTYPADAVISFTTPRHLYVECKSIDFTLNKMLVYQPRSLLRIVQNAIGMHFLTIVIAYQQHDKNLTEAQIAELVATEAQKQEYQKGIEDYAKTTTTIVRQLEDAWRGIEDEAISVAKAKYDA